MQLFGENFLKLRNDYIIPSIGYGVVREKYKHWLFKDILTKKVISLNKKSKTTYEIEISKSDYYKALHCDRELLINKTILQYSDFLKSSKQTGCWSYVNLYYFTFFAVNSLFRFLNKGFIYLNSSHKKSLQDFSIAVNSEPISVDTGNYFYNYKEENDVGNIILTLVFKGESVHKMNWLMLEETLQQSLPFTDDDEESIYKVFIRLFKDFDSEFPSHLRNKLNYNSDSSILDFEKRITYQDIISLNKDFIKGLFNIDYTKTDINQINGVVHIGLYMFKMVLNLHSEYLLRSTYGKDFQKERRTFLKNNNIDLDKDLLYDNFKV